MFGFFTVEHRGLGLCSSRYIEMEMVCVTSPRTLHLPHIPSLCPGLLLSHHLCCSELNRLISGLLES